MLDDHAGGGESLEFRVLGPLEAAHKGQPLDLGPHKQRSLLALLLIHANRVVSTDRILDELWGDDAEGKENALWVYVSRLRAILEPEREKRGESTVLLRRDHGYELSVDPDSIDSSRFEEKIREGKSVLLDDPAQASDLFGEALELWRGSAFEDFLYEEFAQPEIHRLAEVRVEAIEDRIEADLRRGITGELIAELEAITQQYPLRERPMNQLMLALYRSGRQADALRAFERFRRGVGEELGIEPSPELRRLEEQILLHDSRLQPRRTKRSTTAAVSGRNPFKGLRAFEVDDAEDFFGRDRLIADILRRVSDGNSLIALVGASGSGKSSVLRAGVLPALQKGAVLESDQWLFADMMPGSRPFDELEAALLHSTLDAPQSLSDQLGDDDDAGLLRAALRLLPGRSGRLVLFIDQFEELFTLVDDAERRDRFLGNLVTAIDDTRSRVLVVLTLRADFYDRPLQHHDFSARLNDGIVNVSPMSPDELEAAAVAPAQQAGAVFEPSLLTALMTDVINQPGGLPLFQHTLRELYDRRVGDTMTIASYAAMGGVRGTLSRRAEDLYAKLDSHQQAACRQLLLRLVAIAEGDEWSRRRTPASEVLALDVSSVTLQPIIESFGKHRLLSFDRDQLTGAPTIEVAHEALLTEWPRLRDWIDESHEDVVRHTKLSAEAQEWQDAGENQDYLPSGTRLDDYVDWAAATSMLLTNCEKAYLDAAVEKRRETRCAEDDRIAQERKVERSAKRRLWGLVAAVVVLASVGVGIALSMLSSPTTVVVVSPAIIDGTGIGGLLEDGLELSRKDFGIESTLLSPPFTDLQGDLRRYADDGLDLVIYWDPDFGQEVSAVADDYPDTEWIGLEGGSDIDFAVEEGAFLAGVAAAMTSKTGIVGFLGGVQIESIERFRAGYEAGATAARPGTKVISQYASGTFAFGFGAAGYGHSAAEGLYQSGADVVFHAAGGAGSGLFEAAESESVLQGRNLWAIGVDSDQYWEVPASQRSRVLTSMLKRFDQVVYELISDYESSGRVDRAYLFTLRDGVFGYSTTGGFLKADTIAALETFKAEIQSGDRIVNQLPGKELGPPADAFEIFDASVTYDGTMCSYAGSSEASRGRTIRVTFRNDSPDTAELTIQGDTVSYFDLQIRATPNDSMVGYVTLIGSEYELSCNATIRGGVEAVASSKLAVLPETKADVAILVTVTENQCTVGDVSGVRAGDLVTLDIDMQADVGGGAGLGLLHPGMTVEDWERDVTGAWRWYGRTGAEPGDVSQRVIEVQPGNWLIDCWWADGRNVEPGKVFVVEPQSS